MVVFCTYCGQSFTRDEHLERHILTHTNVKPFKCFTCHMSFARRDLLQRHYTVHGRDANNQEGLPPNHGMIPRSAGRTPIACSNCAKTKTKCDKKFPCSRCASRNLQCTLRPSRRSSKNANRLPSQEDTVGSGSSSDQGSGDVRTGSTGSSPQLQSQSQSALQIQADMGAQLNTPPEEMLQADMSTGYFDQSPPNVGTPAMSIMLSPLPTPSLGFVQPNQMSMFGELGGSGENMFNQTTNPQSIMDWQVQMPLTYDAMDNPDFMFADLGLNAHGIPYDDHNDMFDMSSDFAQHMAPSVHTHMPKPGLERSHSDMDMGCLSSTLYEPNHFSNEDTVAPDLATIMATQEGWSAFRCR